jgi:hypothetical protein
MLNQNETDVDCGGSCPVCDDGDSCENPSDCSSGVCAGDACQEPSCEDGVKNGTEASTDCGGDCGDCVFDIDRVILGSTTTTGQVTITWDSSGLDFAFVVSDTTPFDDSGALWEDDSVEIYLDLNNGKTASYQGDDFQIQVGLNSATAGGPGAVSWGDLQITQDADAGGYTMDIHVPWAAIGASGSPPLGATIGFDIGINDDTNGGGRDAQLMIYGSDQNFNNTSGWGELTLN